MDSCPVSPTAFLLRMINVFYWSFRCNYVQLSWGSGDAIAFNRLYQQFKDGQLALVFDDFNDVQKNRFEYQYTL